MKRIYLPNPILRPPEWTWPEQNRTEEWSIPLRIACETGGALKRYFEAVIATGPYRWWEGPSDLYGAGTEFVYELAAEEWLAKGPNRTIEFDETAPSLAEQAEICLPQTRENFNELDWHRQIKDYAEEMGIQRETSLHGLRYFAGFLKRRKLDPQSIAELEWMRLQSLLSIEPIVSVSLPANGKPSSILNPTLAIVRMQTSLRAIARIEEGLIEHDLDWQEAALIDELFEDGRILRVDLLRRLKEKNHRLLERTRTDEAALEGLEEKGFVLNV